MSRIPVSHFFWGFNAEEAEGLGQSAFDEFGEAEKESTFLFVRLREDMVFVVEVVECLG